ncbi:MAG: indolepyruvate oxidoreductase subunit beta [Bacteroidales bacterium]|jgi:indolepyruvate ferredoxin oxidoreductase beta subunit|nr:indolepyruvate oxidoreductase subunit beta [Bacteroidales bacterium]NLM93333.1 indolepyruvate oxidoreductase subunit beta [Bacteroidales bacterium]
MKIDIILAGVGGQGILSIAATIGYAAVEAGLHLKQAEVHGMSQRGGDVQSHMRLSDQEIASDLIPKGQADLIISVEPMESLRYLPYLKKDGWLITNTKPFINISNYPDEEKLMAEIKALPNHIALDADSVASELGSVKAANMVVLGAASPFINIDFEKLENAIRTLFGRKGEELVTLNLNALNTGRKFSMEAQK